MRCAVCSGVILGMPAGAPAGVGAAFVALATGATGGAWAAGTAGAASGTWGVRAAFAFLLHRPYLLARHRHLGRNKNYPLNETYISIRSLYSPPAFKDTVGKVVNRNKEGRRTDPAYCFKAPHAPTGKGNCTTRIEAYFSNANATLVTTMMEACSIITWIPVSGTGHSYDQWVHAGHAKAIPTGAMCDWTKPGSNIWQLCLR